MAETHSCVIVCAAPQAAENTMKKNRAKHWTNRWLNTSLNFAQMRIKPNENKQNAIIQDSDTY